MKNWGWAMVVVVAIIGGYFVAVDFMDRKAVRDKIQAEEDAKKEREAREHNHYMQQLESAKYISQGLGKGKRAYIVKDWIEA